MRWLLVLLLLLSLPRLAGAADDAPTQGRILHRFNFEERPEGNYEDLPMHWSRVGGPGMPHYVRGILATDHTYSGRFSFRLDLNGGSVLYRLAPGRLPVQPGAHYRVGGQVRTTVLKFARARMSAYFVDEAGQLISGTVRHSAPYAAAQEAQGWVALDLEMPPAPPEAHSLIVEVGLLQPAQMGGGGQGAALADSRLDLGRFQQDVRGSAWFDDIIVSRVPSVSLLSPAAGNIFAKGQAVWFIAGIDDQATADLSAGAVVWDAAGAEAARVAGQFIEAEAGQTQERLIAASVWMPPTCPWPTGTTCPSWCRCCRRGG